MDERKLAARVLEIITELHESLPPTRCWGPTEWAKHFASLRETDETAHTLMARRDAEAFLAKILASIHSDQECQK